MISREIYHIYFTHLLKGERRECADIVKRLLNTGTPLKTIYLELFQKSLYQVGALWELNEISVAREHLATAITEGLFNLTYPLLFREKPGDEKVVIACVANEFHQVGGRMVADMFQMHGWDAHFVGANTPSAHLLNFIDEEKPRLLGLSLSVYFNVPDLQRTIETVRGNFSQLDLVVGGQAFQWGSTDFLKAHGNIEYIPGLDILDHRLSPGGEWSIAP
ncbi:MAG: cobalamin-dependent protein [Desulfobacterales bacterium]|nr:cobalamin-dependent protein [Desulfobacterales bacterium]